MEKKISKSKKSKDKENRKAKDKIKITNKEKIRKIGELLDLDIEMTDETIHQEKIENIDNENKNIENEKINNKINNNNQCDQDNINIISDIENKLSPECNNKKPKNKNIKDQKYIKDEKIKKNNKIDKEEFTKYIKEYKYYEKINTFLESAISDNNITKVKGIQTEKINIKESRDENLSIEDALEDIITKNEKKI